MAKAQRRSPVSRKAQEAMARPTIHSFVVKWKRPGLDVVRVGQGWAVGFNADGSLKIRDRQNGGHRAIMPEHVRRRVSVKGRLIWRPWAERDTVGLAEAVKLAAAPAQDETMEVSDADEGH